MSKLFAYNQEGRKNPFWFYHVATGIDTKEMEVYFEQVFKSSLMLLINYLIDVEKKTTIKDLTSIDEFKLTYYSMRVCKDLNLRDEITAATVMTIVHHYLGKQCTVTIKESLKSAVEETNYLLQINNLGVKVPTESKDYYKAAIKLCKSLKNHNLDFSHE